MSYITTPAIKPQFIGTDAVGLAGALTITLTANQVYLYLFETPVPITITGVKWRMGITIGGHTNMGIYTYAGNLVAGSDTGAQLNVASTNQSFSYGSAITLAPGSYWIALANDDGSDTYEGITAPAGGPILSRARAATNALAAGALPLTTGTITTPGTKVPGCALQVSGGI
jgi:hypothetical protein